jgi:hypothetical protein
MQVIHYTFALAIRKQICTILRLPLPGAELLARLFQNLADTERTNRALVAGPALFLFSQHRLFADHAVVVFISI